MRADDGLCISKRRAHCVHAVRARNEARNEFVSVQGVQRGLASAAHEERGGATYRTAAVYCECGVRAMQLCRWRGMRTRCVYLRPCRGIRTVVTRDLFETAPELIARLRYACGCHVVLQLSRGTWLIPPHSALLHRYFFVLRHTKHPSPAVYPWFAV